MIADAVRLAKASQREIEAALKLYETRQESTRTEMVVIEPERPDGEYSLASLKQTIIEAISEAGIVPGAKGKDKQTAEPPMRKRVKGATVNERMAAMIQEDPSLLCWSASKWAERLGVTATAVKISRTWTKTIRTTRAMQKADRVSRGR